MKTIIVILSLGLVWLSVLLINERHRMPNGLAYAYYDGVHDALAGKITVDRAADEETDLKYMPELFR